MEQRRRRRRHLNPKIKRAMEMLAGSCGAVIAAAFLAQCFGIAIGAIK